MNRHLIAIEVSVESDTDQGMDLDSTAVDEHWLECLNTQSM
jgi:hypothetical protein